MGTILESCPLYIEYFLTYFYPFVTLFCIFQIIAAMMLVENIEATYPPYAYKNR